MVVYNDIQMWASRQEIVEESEVKSQALQQEPEDIKVQRQASRQEPVEVNEFQRQAPRQKPEHVPQKASKR